MCYYRTVSSEGFEMHGGGSGYHIRIDNQGIGFPNPEECAVERTGELAALPNRCARPLPLVRLAGEVGNG